jgi:hypothetical protein
MADTVVEALVFELLLWLAKRERSYEEVMDAWRTSCPRLPVWEDANDRGTRHEGRSERALCCQDYTIGACPSWAAQTSPLVMPRVGFRSSLSSGGWSASRVPDSNRFAR